MTTGNVTRDSQVAVGTTNGPGLIGPYLHKVWSGGDYPPIKPSKGSVPPLKGHLYRQRYPDGSFKWRLYRSTDTVPKRARSENHAYNVSVYEFYDRVNTYIDGVGNFHSGTFRNTIGGFPTMPENWSSNDNLNLLSQLRVQVAGSDFNAGVFLGEGREALKMIGDAATRIFKAYKFTKKGNLFGAVHALLDGRDIPSNVYRKAKATQKFVRGTVANDWLQLQYGWLPLLDDVRGAAEFLAHNLNYPLVKRYRVSKKRVTRLTQPSVVPSDVVSNSAYVQTRSALIAYVTEVDVYKLSGLTNPLSVAWELMPFSFVADWFLPIGAWLDGRGLSSALTGSFVRSTLVEKRIIGAVGINGFNYSSDFTEVTIRFDREVALDLFSFCPPPSFKPLAKVASWQHAANAVALLNQLF